MFVYITSVVKEHLAQQRSAFPSNARNIGNDKGWTFMLARVPQAFNVSGQVIFSLNENKMKALVRNMIKVNIGWIEYIVPSRLSLKLRGKLRTWILFPLKPNIEKTGYLKRRCLIL